MKVLLYCTKASPYLLPKYSLTEVIKLGTQLYDTSEVKDSSFNGTICGECEIEAIEKVVPFFCNDVEKFERESCMTMKEVAQVTNFDGYALYLKNVKVLDKVKSLRDIWHYDVMDRKVENVRSMIRVFDQGEFKILLPIRSEDLNKILNGDKTIIVRSSILQDMKQLII